ncbi:MAG TPA: type VI secretion system baseplate subunit TssG [Reyranella sp.]|nr:type VI secretion system baseplate subunit TssG [Reyranella sp.]
MSDAFSDFLEFPERQDFLLALRRLESAFSDRPRIGSSESRRQEYVTLGQNPSLAFPPSTIDAAKRTENGGFALFQQFLGLCGPQGALPLALTHESYQYFRADDDALARFLDLFNNRFLQLFFRAWADARPIAQHDRPDDDRFENYVGASIGLGSAVYHDLDGLPDMAKVGYAGLMAPAAKSASRLRDLVAGLFGVRVEVQEFVGLRLILEPEEHSRLGRANSQLGVDAMMGSSVYSVQDKFRLRLYVPTLAQYARFLPTGNLARPLADIIHFYVGMALEYDVELALPAGEAAPMQLGVSGQLGWTSWLAPDWSSREEWRTDARFDLARRFAARERRA